MLQAGVEHGSKPPFQRCNCINGARSRKVDRASAGNSELKLERAWLVMRENLRQNTRFNFGASGYKVAVIPRATRMSSGLSICCKRGGKSPSDREAAFALRERPAAG